MYKFDVIKTKNGCFIKEGPDYNSVYLENYYRVNGTIPKKTNSVPWYFVECESIECVERKMPCRYENQRYELIDPALAGDKIKLVLLKDEVEVDYDGYWTGKYATLKSLYKFLQDECEEEYQAVEFELNVIAEISDFEFDTIKMSKDIPYSKVIRHQAIDKIVFPSIVLPTKPCKIESADLYKIIRNHIKDNINPLYAEITSDYDFCFTVKKKIKLHDPEPYEVDVNSWSNAFSKRKKKPKYETRYRKDRRYEIFEMTHAESRYSNYSVLADLHADNEFELKQKLDEYLFNLIEYINRPVVDCPHCNGYGVVIDEKVDVTSIE